MNILWILIIIAIPVAVYFIFIRTRKHRQEKFEKDLLNSLGIPNVPKDWTNSEATPNGMRVLWNDNPFNSDAEKQLVFSCYDIGFRNAFNAMAPKFPTWDFNPALVNIGIVAGSAKNLDGSEALMTTSGQAAGAVIGTGDGYPLLTIIVPSQKPNGWRYTDQQMRVTWYELEHHLEYRSDTVIFMENSGRVPNRPDYHPHHPLPADVPEIPAPVAPNAPRSLAAVPIKLKCAV